MLKHTLVAAGGIILAVSLLHIALGPAADVLLGANYDEATLNNPVLDSQNRFYGAAFALYGLLLIYCSIDLVKYRTVLFILLATFFFAGLVRIISVIHTGWPPPVVVCLFIAELVIPPVLMYWLWKLPH